MKCETMTYDVVKLLLYLIVLLDEKEKFNDFGCCFCHKIDRDEVLTYCNVPVDHKADTARGQVTLTTALTVDRKHFIGNFDFLYFYDVS